MKSRVRGSKYIQDSWKVGGGGGGGRGRKERLNCFSALGNCTESLRLFANTLQLS